jgi:hypothetical protein
MPGHLNLGSNTALITYDIDDIEQVTFKKFNS